MFPRWAGVVSSAIRTGSVTPKNPTGDDTELKSYRGGLYAEGHDNTEDGSESVHRRACFERYDTTFEVWFHRI